MTLGDKQRLMVRLQTDWCLYVFDHGYSLKNGDAQRNKRAFGMMGDRKGYGHPYSNHKIMLAHDWHLFRNVGTEKKPQWEYCSATEDHLPFGEYWESMHELCRWGGRFSSPDGNHYSLEHNGRR